LEGRELSVEAGFDLVKKERKSENGLESGKEELELGFWADNRAPAQMITILELREAAV
jgi:hypothetical protein